MTLERLVETLAAVEGYAIIAGILGTAATHWRRWRAEDAAAAEHEHQDQTAKVGAP